jgi:tetratricopeptide (TPR) repeat protein
MFSFALIPYGPIQFFVLIITVLFLSHSVDALAASPEELKQNAQQAYLAGRYPEAVAANREIAEKHPESRERRYAVQMLGTIHEDNLVDLHKAVKWDREFLEKYATPQQKTFYENKISSLEKLLQQKQDEAFAAYQAVKFANRGDEELVRGYEELLKNYPDFTLKARVKKELGYAYARMDKRKESYQALQDLSRSNNPDFSATDRLNLDKARRHWLLTRVWGGVAWGVIVILWVIVLLMKPWQRLDRAALRTFAIWAGVWLLLSASRLPSYFALLGKGDELLFPESAVYVAAGLNLAVLLWLWLLTRGNCWPARPRAFLWLSPPLTLLMTTAVFYLFMVLQPNGPVIIDAFGVKYRHWAEELQKPGRVQSPKTGESGH